MSQRVAVLVFPGFQILDAAGPIAAFEAAGSLVSGGYRLQVCAVQGGEVASSSGVLWFAAPLPRVSAIDTLIVVGGQGTRQAVQCASTRRFLLRCARAGLRIASVCSGTFLLAAAGLLDGKRATTHWSRSDELQRRFPRVQVAADKIFIREGNLWTSAGISAGIDLALALIERDCGEAVARRCAKELVVYYRRPGGQAQFSLLQGEACAEGSLAALMDEVRSGLGQPWPVARLAQRAKMSERSFARAFAAATGIPPARWVEQLRVETASAVLESRPVQIAEVAQAMGFGNIERMRRSFIRHRGLPPSAFRRAGSA